MLMWQERNYAFDKRNTWMTVGNLNITLYNIRLFHYTYHSSSYYACITMMII